MGLKESGLRGGFRNTSSVLPALFDVTITNTNSPVQEGDILTVDYSADNTGDAQDMQDIRLEIDSVQEDVDPDVMLAGGASTTGTLEWDTTGEDEAEYTATVLSDDDSDSVMVEIGSAIPDSVASRPNDDNSTNATGESGLEIETKTEWPSIGARISNNTTEATTAYLRTNDSTLIESVDISTLSSGDTFTFDSVDLAANSTFRITLDAGGNEFTAGFILGGTDYPYTSEDIDITARIFDGGDPEDSSAVAVNDIGNTGFD